MSINSILTDTSPLPILFNPHSILEEKSSPPAGYYLLQQNGVAQTQLFFNWLSQTENHITYLPGEKFSNDGINISTIDVPSSNSFNSDMITKLSNLNCSWNMYPKASKSSIQIEPFKGEFKRTKTKFWCNLFGKTLNTGEVWLAGEYTQMKTKTCGTVKYGYSNDKIHTFDNAKYGNYGINVSKVSDIIFAPANYFSPNDDGVFFETKVNGTSQIPIFAPTVFYSYVEQVDISLTIKHLLMNMVQLPVLEGVVFNINCKQFVPTEPDYDKKMLSFHQSYDDKLIPAQVYDAVVSTWFQIFSYDLKSLVLKNKEFILNCTEDLKGDCEKNVEYNKIGYCIKTTIGSEYCLNNPDKCNLIFSKICIENPISTIKSLGSSFYPKSLEESEIYIASPTCDYWYNKIKGDSTAFVKEADGSCKEIPWDESAQPTILPFINPDSNCTSFTLADNDFRSKYLQDNCNYVYNYYACACPGAQIYDKNNNPITTTLCDNYCNKDPETKQFCDPNSLDREQKCDVYKYLLSNAGACSCFIGSDQSRDYYSRILQDPAFENAYFSKIGGLASPLCTESCSNYFTDCMNGGCRGKGNLTYNPKCNTDICIIDQTIDIGNIKGKTINIGDVTQECGGTKGTSTAKYSCINNKCVEDPNGNYNLSDCTKYCSIAQDLYSCIEGKCVKSQNGDTLENCLKKCENTGMKFICNSFEQTCQQDSTGASDQSYNQCEFGCSQKMKTIHIVSIVSIIVVILLIAVFIFASYK